MLSRLPLCRSMLMCLALIQSLSVSGAGLRQLPQDVAGQTPTEQVPTPDPSALSPDERTALVGELAAAPAFSIKVSQTNDVSVGSNRVSISEARVRAVHRGTVVSADPETAPANDYAINVNLSLHSESEHEVTGVKFRFTNPSAPSAFVVNSALPQSTLGDFAYDIPIMLVTGDPSQFEIELVSVSFRNPDELGNFAELHSIEYLPREQGLPASQPGKTDAETPSQPPDSPAGSSSNSPGSQAIATTVDQLPRALNHPRPIYTAEARFNKVSGDVEVRVLIDKQGNTGNLQVISWLPDGLTEQAIRAIKEMKFSPALRSGQPVDYFVTIEIEFDMG
ncbi:MAG TPA: energy transducer TonB [Blastocatellia bacterium]